MNKETDFAINFPTQQDLVKILQDFDEEQNKIHLHYKKIYNDLRNDPLRLLEEVKSLQNVQSLTDTQKACVDILTCYLYSKIYDRY